MIDTARLGRDTRAIAALALIPVFFLAPDGASPWLIWPCLIVFYLNFFAAIRRPDSIRAKLHTYLTIEVLFSIFFYIVFLYLYQLYVVGKLDLGASSFLVHRAMFVDQSNRAVVIALVAILTFSLGLRRQAGRKSTPPDLIGKASEDFRVLEPVIAVMLAGLIVIYLASGWRTAGEGRYTGTTRGGAIADGVALMIVVLAMMAIALIVTRVANRQRVSIWLWMGGAMAGYWESRLFMLGDRNTLLLLAIVAVGGLLTFRWSASRVVLLVLAMAALLVYNGVEVLRSSGDVTPGALWSQITNPTTEERADSSDSSFNITTVGLRAGLATVPSEYGFGFGRYKAIGFAGVVPMIRGAVLHDSSTEFMTTSQLLSNAVLGPSATWGVGTNVISDLYIDFGPLGVPVGMYLVGAFAGWVRGRVRRESESPKWVTIYLITLASFAELPRYSLDFPVRMLAWSALLFWSVRVLDRHRFGVRQGVGVCPVSGVGPVVDD